MFKTMHFYIQEKVIQHNDRYWISQLRLFSVAGKIFRPDGCCLTDKRFEELMFLRCNYHITETNT